MPVPYVPYGQDATVSYGTLDFKFKNNTSFPILIWAENIDNRLYIAFYGSEAPPAVVWHHTVLRVFKAGKCYKHNPKLKYGEEYLLDEGMDGGIIESRVTITGRNGAVSEKYMGKSYYDPLPYLYQRKLY